MTMTTSDLTRDMRFLGLPEDHVTVGGMRDDHHCILQTDAGDWEVFYYERGVKVGLEVLTVEHVACTYLLARLRTIGCSVSS